MQLEHGGNISAAARRFNIPLAQWTDLSTGISPCSWPVPALPPSVWQTLPYADEQLEDAAALFYGCARDAVLAVPGSQYALQYTPALLRRGRVAMPLRGYAEHRAAWVAAGHQIVDYVDGAALRRLVESAAVDHAVLINPNNPTGELLPLQQVQGMLRQLQDNGGWLVVDEAFIDASPQASVAPLCPAPGLVVYRSVGKFFGLAGIRLGFMLAPLGLCQQLASGMPPWLLSHPARWVGLHALGDSDWQRAQRGRLAIASEQWMTELQALVPQLLFAGAALFVTGTGTTRYVDALYLALARRAVLVRLFGDMDECSMLRFGLPMPSERERVLQLLRESVEECECAMG